MYTALSSLWISGVRALCMAMSLSTCIWHFHFSGQLSGITTVALHVWKHFRFSWKHLVFFWGGRVEILNVFLCWNRGHHRCVWFAMWWVSEEQLEGGWKRGEYDSPLQPKNSHGIAFCKDPPRGNAYWPSLSLVVSFPLLSAIQKIIMAHY